MIGGIDKHTLTCLHFDSESNIGKDECGNAWNAYGAPTIKNDRVKFGKSSFYSNGGYLENTTLKDIFDLFKAHGPNGQKYAFTIQEEGGVSGEYLYIGSREAKLFDSAPTVNYTYEYFPANYDVADLSADFASRKKAIADLSSELTINNGMRSDDIESDITVVGHEDTAEIGIDIYTRKIMIDTQLACDDLTIARNVPNDKERAPEINSVITVNGYESLVDVSINDMSINSHEDIDDLDSDMFVTGKAVINADLLIRKFHGAGDLMVDFGVKKDIPLDKAPYISASMIVAGSKQTVDMPANITVRHADCSEIIADVDVRGKNQLIDINAEMSIYPHDEAYIAISDFGVKGYHMISDGIEVSLEVKPHADIAVEDFAISKQDTPTDIECSMTVRPTWAKDIAADMTTTKNSKKPYAFIM